MGGLVLDIFIAFAIRTSVNAWRKLASANWPIYPGEISSFRYEERLWGCDYGEYMYRYTIDGHSHEGIYRKPFFMRRSREVRKSGSIGKPVEVRVSPQDPRRSVLIGL
jgi:Protein of unknown function (DUF3592)